MSSEDPSEYGSQSAISAITRIGLIFVSLAITAAVLVTAIAE